MKKTIYIYSILIILLIIGVYFSISSMSVIGTEEGLDYIKSFRCDTSQDCIDSLVDNGVSLEGINEALEDDNLKFTCIKNVCGVSAK